MSETSTHSVRYAHVYPQHIVLRQSRPTRGRGDALACSLGCALTRTKQKTYLPDQTRVTVAQAAQILGLSAEAVRMRIKRGTLEHEKVGNTVYVVLDEADQTQPNPELSVEPTTDQTALIRALRAEVEFLREEMRRREERHAEETRPKDHLLAAALERIPELEAPSEARGSPESAARGGVGCSPGVNVHRA